MNWSKSHKMCSVNCAIKPTTVQLKNSYSYLFCCDAIITFVISLHFNTPMPVNCVVSFFLSLLWNLRILKSEHPIIERTGLSPHVHICLYKSRITRKQQYQCLETLDLSFLVRIWLLFQILCYQCKSIFHKHTTWGRHMGFQVGTNKVCILGLLLTNSKAEEYFGLYELHSPCEEIGTLNVSTTQNCHVSHHSPDWKLFNMVSSA